MAVIICPCLAIGAVIQILEPTIYPAGDFRNEMAFRLVFYGAFIALGTIGFVLSLRWLLNDRRAG
jgi:cobalamin biosynthesis protein CobD/CbiB